MNIIFCLFFIASGWSLGITLMYLVKYKIWHDNKGCIGRILMGSIFGLIASTLLCQFGGDRPIGTPRDVIVGMIVLLIISISLFLLGYRYYQSTKIGEIDRLYGYIYISTGIIFFLMSASLLCLLFQKLV